MSSYSLSERITKKEKYNEHWLLTITWSSLVRSLVEQHSCFYFFGDTSSMMQCKRMHRCFMRRSISQWCQFFTRKTCERIIDTSFFFFFGNYYLDEIKFTFENWIIQSCRKKPKKALQCHWRIIWRQNLRLFPFEKVAGLQSSMKKTRKSRSVNFDFMFVDFCFS